MQDALDELNSNSTVTLSAVSNSYVTLQEQAFGKCGRLIYGYATIEMKADMNPWTNTNFAKFPNNPYKPIAFHTISADGQYGMVSVRGDGYVNLNALAITLKNGNALRFEIVYLAA